MTRGLVFVQAETPDGTPGRKFVEADILDLDLDSQIAWIVEQLIRLDPRLIRTPIRGAHDRIIYRTRRGATL